MIEITFIYESKQIFAKCKGNEKIKDIFLKYSGDQNKDKKSVLFLYKGNKINEELEVDKIISENDKELSKMAIIVYNIEKHILIIILLLNQMI